MPELVITRNYADGDVLMESDLDNLQTPLVDLNNTIKYDDENLQSRSIQAAHLIDDTVTTATLGLRSVETNKIATGAVTTIKIADSEIGAVNIADMAVTTAKVPDNNITTAKIDSTTRLPLAKLTSKGFFGSGTITTTVTAAMGETLVGSFTTSQDVRNLLILLQPQVANDAFFGIESGVDSPFPSGVQNYTNHLGTFRIKLNGSTIATRTLAFNQQRESFALNLYIPASTIATIHQTAITSGSTISITAELAVSGGNGIPDTTPPQILITNCRLVAVEL